MFARRTLTALLLGAATFATVATLTPALAAETAPAAAPAAPAPPSPAALAAADQILANMGVKETLAVTVPSMMAELERNITTTHPDIRDSVRATLKAIQPDFDKSAQETYEKAEALLTVDMTEKELTDVAAFFASPSGKKFLVTEPVFFQQLGGIVDPWRSKLSTDIVTRARDEMKKKGVDF
jgi:uncharacterized protein